MSRRWEGEEGRKDGGGRGSSRCKGPRWEEEHHAVEKLKQAPHALPTESRCAPQGLVNIRENEYEGARCPMKQHKREREH